MSTEDEKMLDELEKRYDKIVNTHHGFEAWHVALHNAFPRLLELARKGCRDEWIEMKTESLPPLLIPVWATGYCFGGSSGDRWEAKVRLTTTGIRHWEQVAISDESTDENWRHCYEPTHWCHLLDLPKD